jgi:hypothetical protein
MEVRYTYHDSLVLLVVVFKSHRILEIEPVLETIILAAILSAKSLRTTTWTCTITATKGPSKWWISALCSALSGESKLRMVGIGPSSIAAGAWRVPIMIRTLEP